jgi:eukaryotic-like serine/threonine-protein kinase
VPFEGRWGRLSVVEARQIFGARYRLEERLGEGGMAVVWRAFDLVLGRWVAVKVLSAELAADANFRESILTEAQAAARVSHPHLAAVHDYGESFNSDGEPMPYVVMELLTGRSLTERLASGPLPPRAGLRVCAEIASGLATAHAANLVHQDVKPGNVMLTPTGAKLVDFGVAAIAGAPDESGASGKIMGTPNYVAPERLLGGPVVPATDVYGLGLLIFRVLTGHLPWPPGEPRLSTRADPDPLPAIEGVPPAIGALYDRCMAMNPDDRPTAREAASILAAAVGVRPVFSDGAVEEDGDDGGGGEAVAPVRYIGDVTTGEQVLAPVPPSAPQRPAVIVTPHRRGRAVGVAIAVLAAGLIAALVILVNGRPGQPPAYADGPRPTPSAPSSGDSSGPPAVQEPSGGEPGGGVVTVTVIGTQTIVVTVPPNTNGSPPTTEPGPSRTAPSVSARRTFTHRGNSVSAQCVRGTQAHIVRAVPAPGYQVRTDPGPARKATAVFLMGTFRITMTVTCVDGVPTVEITES